MIITLKVDFDGITKRYCWGPWTEIYEHLPHMWYDPKTFRNHFCKGYDW